jgi:hypothetical protein
MKVFQKMMDKTSGWVGVVFSCVMLFFFLVQLIILIGEI